MAVGYNKNNKAVKRVENSKFTKRSFIKKRHQSGHKYTACQPNKRIEYGLKK